MDFSFNENQILIADVADAFLADLSGSESVRAVMATEQGFDAELWARITQEMGWQLTHIPKTFSGLGFGYVELCILLERMGKNLLCAPFFSLTCLGINSLLVAGTDDQKTFALERIASTGALYTLAYAGTGRHWGIDSVTAKYAVTPSGATLNGLYSHVIDGHIADTLVVAARKSGSGPDEGIGLFVVAADTPGVQTCWTPGVDQTRRLAEVRLQNVEVPPNAIMQQEGHAEDLLQQILSLASIGIAAEQLGVSEKSLALTVEYITVRKQFGRTVGGFQAMKHKAADMLTKVEAARSAVYYAACIADEFFRESPLGSELEEAASIAKTYCCDAAFFNAGSALQMHGGIGFTWEHDIHLYFKRAKSAQISFGDSAWHKERLAQIILDGGL